VLSIGKSSLPWQIGAHRQRMANDRDNRDSRRRKKGAHRASVKSARGFILPFRRHYPDFRSEGLPTQKCGVSGHRKWRPQDMQVEVGSLFGTCQLQAMFVADLACIFRAFVYAYRVWARTGVLLFAGNESTPVRTLIQFTLVRGCQKVRSVQSVQSYPSLRP